MERKDLLPSLQSTICYSPSERKVPKCVLYIHVVRHGHFLLIPMVPASDTSTISHLGCHTPRLCMSLAGQRKPVLMPATPWVSYCKLSMLF